MGTKTVTAITTLALILALSAPAHAKGVYVSAQAGSDANSCLSQAQACLTVDRGEAVAIPGDTVNLWGVFTQQVDLNKSGTSASPLTYQALPGTQAVFDGGSLPPSAGGPGILRIVRASWLVLRNLEIRESPQKGLTIIAGNFNRIENLHTHHNFGTGVQILTGGAANVGENNTFVNIESHNNFEPWAGGGNSDGVSCSNGANNNTFIGLRLYHNSDDGIDVLECPSNTIQDSWAWFNGYGPNPADVGQQGNGDGFKLGRGGGNTCLRCVAFENRMRGINYNGATIRNTIVNSSSFRNGNPPGTGRNFNFPSGAVMMNNISWQGTLNLGGDLTQQANSWQLGITNPQFINATDENHPGFARLGPGSPAIDRGVDVGQPFNGSAPDLGAYEAGGSAPPPPQPGIIQFTTTAYNVSESGAFANITATRTGGSSGPVSVNYTTTTGGTATAGADYGAANGTLTWVDGDASPRVVSVPLVDDTEVEPQETFGVVLSNAQGATLGSPSSTTVTIDSDDS
jgi:hypothetical protein